MRDHSQSLATPLCVTTMEPAFVFNQVNRTFELTPLPFEDCALALIELKQSPGWQQWPHHSISLADQYEGAAAPVDIKHQKHRHLSPDSEETVHRTGVVLQEGGQFASIHE
jgi:hypothetical protein